MAKVVVINVDLGIDINQIIAASTQELTEGAKKELDNAIEVAKAAKNIKSNKTTARTELNSQLSNLMEEIFISLEKAGSNGVSVESIIDRTKHLIPNTSAFTLRMNNILSIKGNPYRLVRAKINGIPHYLFTAFNSTIPNDS